MGPLVATYVCALVLLALSLLVGRGIMLLFGRREASFIEGAVGVAVLVLACSVAIRLPGGEKTSIATVVLLALGAAAILFWKRDRVLGPNVGLAVLPSILTVALVSFPFVSSGHLGLPGVGVNNDMAMHLVFADWLVDPSGATPAGIARGYPIGPQALVASVTEILGTEPLRGFVGLIIAVPVLTAIASLAVLREQRPLPRILGAAFVPVAYLSASVLGIASFKEQLMALWLISFALALRQISRRGEGGIAMVIALAAICGGAIATYSYPGLGWLAGTAVIWAALELLRIRREGPPGRVGDVVREALPVVAVVGGLLLLLGLTQINRVLDFLDAGAFDIVTGTDSKLRYTVSPFEALGAWPSGSWLLGTSDVELFWLFGALGLAALGYAVAWAWRRGELALLAALGAAAVVYLGTVLLGGRYVETKALAIPASLIMLLALAALLRRDDRASPFRIGLAILFIGVAAYSSFLALRDTTVAPPDRFDELTELRDEVAGSKVIVFTSDRYTDYYLRGAEVQSPAINAEVPLAGRFGKGQRLPVDFDSVFGKQLNDFDYAITTRADYQSAPPPNFEPVRETESYVLWKRNGLTPFVGVLAEEARPGRIFRCGRKKYKRLLEREGVAIVWPRPVIAKRLYWEPDLTLAPGESASQSVELPEGKWDLSMQYQSEVVPLTVEAGGESFEIPPGVEGAIPFRGAQGPFWPVGEIQSEGGKVEITVTAGEISGVQKLLGVDAEAEIGNIAATRLSEISIREFKEACGLYLDHYYTGEPGALIADPGVTVPLYPER
ncbi:MAG: hypothetical protein ACXWE8_10095 [Solirubrobacterales bacterium]